MSRLRSKNINTREYWNKRYFFLKHNVPPVASVKLFFEYDLLPKNEEYSVLEIGCGVATHYPYFNKNYPKIKLTGLDISNFAIAYNQRYKFANFIELDVNTEDIKGEWDYVISAHTFEHLDDPVKTVEKCRQVAKKKVIVCVPYENYWNYDHEHIHRFSKKEPFKNYEKCFVDTDTHKGIYYVFDGYLK